MSNRKVNPLNVYGARRVEFCPPYFEETTFEVKGYYAHRTLSDWIFKNLNGRYYVGKTATIEEDGPIKNPVKVAFEVPSELSLFMLSCPYLK